MKKTVKIADLQATLSLATAAQKQIKGGARGFIIEDDINGVKVGKTPSGFIIDDELWGV